MGLKKYNNHADGLATHLFIYLRLRAWPWLPLWFTHLLCGEPKRIWTHFLHILVTINIIFKKEPVKLHTLLSRSKIYIKSYRKCFTIILSYTHRFWIIKYASSRIYVNWHCEISYLIYWLCMHRDRFLLHKLFR